MESNYAQPGDLDAKQPIQVGTATISEGYMPAVDTSTVSVTGPTGVVETTASEENLSAQYKYPQASQDTVPSDVVAQPGSNI